MGPDLPDPVRTEWRLDNLGNFSADPGGEDKSVITYVDDVEQSSLHHATDLANRITAIYQDAANVTAPTVELHDANGNLTFDGTYSYYYDAFNRLVELHDAAGPHLKYTYDGLGRLITKSDPNAGQNDPVRFDYYYDGMRRIQEVITTNDDPNSPIVSTDREYVYGPDYVDEHVAQLFEARTGRDLE